MHEAQLLAGANAEKIRKKYNALFGYFFLDCEDAENHEFAVKELKIKNFPAIVSFGAGNKTLSKRIIFGKDKKMAEIQEELVEFFEGKLITLTAEK